jgi:hypothetical protein
MTEPPAPDRVRELEAALGHAKEALESHAGGCDVCREIVHELEAVLAKQGVAEEAGRQLAAFRKIPGNENVHGKSFTAGYLAAVVKYEALREWAEFRRKHERAAPSAPEPAAKPEPAWKDAVVRYRGEVGDIALAQALSDRCQSACSNWLIAEMGEVVAETLARGGTFGRGSVTRSLLAFLRTQRAAVDAAALHFDPTPAVGQAGEGGQGPGVEDVIAVGKAFAGGPIRGPGQGADTRPSCGCQLSQYFDHPRGVYGCDWFRPCSCVYEEPKFCTVHRGTVSQKPPAQLSEAEAEALRPGEVRDIRALLAFLALPDYRHETSRPLAQMRDAIVAARAAVAAREGKS